ncbi:MAG: zinc-binding dehydrogenase [Myxococcales bacterium]|nr:zinc-binding dehydrogenase [Myxococcales bacterium]
MKAIVYEKYGTPDVLRLDEVDKPVAGDDDVLVRIRAASLNPYDWHFLTGLPYVGRLSMGVLRPKCSRLGADLAGEVEAVGKNVTRFRPGDEVFGEITSGAFAEYAIVPEDSLAPKPTALTFQQAAAIPMVGFTALQGLRDLGRIGRGKTVLINGASGGVGTFAVQIAKSFGAEVTGACSAKNVELVLSLGADHVVDYTKQDFTRGGQRYDLMLDLIGNRSLSECRRALTPKGVYVSCFGLPDRKWLGPMLRLLAMVVLSPFVSQDLVTWVAKPTKEDLLELKELIEAQKVTPVIDRTYGLSEVPDAIRYLERGHARGKVVISVRG